MVDTTAMYGVWRAAFRGAQPDPQQDKNLCGFWRIRAAKTKPDTPVAIWPALGPDGNPSGQQVLKVGRLAPAAEGSQAWHDFIAWGWTKCLPVSSVAYRSALDTGIWGDDGKTSRTLSVEEITGITEPKDGVATNAPPVADLLADQIANIADSIFDAPEPETQEQANALQGRVDRLGTLLDMAERKRVEEKAPHLTAERQVDAKWRTITLPGEEAKTRAKTMRSAFLKREQARLDAAAKEENERLIAAARERAALIAKDAPPEEAKLIERLAETVVPKVEAEKARVGSPFGRSTGLKATKLAVIDDMAKLAAHFIEIKDSDFTDYMQRRAQAAVRAKAILPGTHKEERDE